MKNFNKILMELMINNMKIDDFSGPSSIFDDFWWILLKYCWLYRYSMMVIDFCNVFEPPIVLEPPKRRQLEAAELEGLELDPNLEEPLKAKLRRDSRQG